MTDYKPDLKFLVNEMARLTQQVALVAKENQVLSEAVRDLSRQLTEARGKFSRFEKNANRTHEAVSRCLPARNI